MSKHPVGKQRGYYLKAALIILAAASLYLLGSCRVNLWDRDEAWYAQTSRQMVQSDNWVVPYFLSQPRYAKPIFVYWCQAISMKLFGGYSYEFAARLPSTLAMVCTLTILTIVIGRATSPRRAMYTVLVFATTGMVIMSAKMCLTDSIMLMFLTVAQICLFSIYRKNSARHLSSAPAIRKEAEALVSVGAGADTECRESAATGSRPETSPNRRTSRLVPLLMWVCVGLAGLTKGPVALVALLATMLVLAAMDIAGRKWTSAATWRQAVSWWPKTRPLSGLLIAVAILLPWLIAAYLRQPDFLTNLLQEPVKHASSNQDGQWRYPGYYLISIWATFFPWSLLLVTALVLGWKHRRTPHVRIALATIIGNWIYAEMMVTKLPHYMLPSFSSLAFLTATAMIRCMRRQHDDMLRRGAVIAAGGWGFATLLISLAPWLPLVYFKNIPFAAAAAFTVAGIVYAAAVFMCFKKRRLPAAAATMGLGMLAVVSLLFAFYFPNASFLRVPSQVGTRLQALGAVGEGQVYMVGYAEPSLAFYQGGTIREPEKKKFYLRDESPENWPRWIVTSSKIYNALPEEKRARLRKIDSFIGLNYNVDGKPVEVLILEKQPS